MEKLLSKIFTHVNADLDSACAVWAILRFKFKLRASKDFDFWNGLIQKEANWDGSGMAEEDVAVDISAGGKGIKGEITEERRVGSAFDAVMKKYAAMEDQVAVQNLICFVDTHDSCGNAIDTLLDNVELLTKVQKDIRGIFSDCSINASFRGFQATYYNDKKAISVFCDMLDGMLKIQQRRLQAQQNYSKYTKWYHNNQIVVVTNAPLAVTGIVFEKKARILIYSDGFNLGIKRDNAEVIRMDHSLIKEVVKKYGEEEEWFAHESGFLYCRGSKKAPAKTASCVNIEELVTALVQLLKEEKFLKKLSSTEAVGA